MDTNSELNLGPRLGFKTWIYPWDWNPRPRANMRTRIRTLNSWNSNQCSLLWSQHLHHNNIMRDNRSRLLHLEKHYSFVSNCREGGGRIKCTRGELSRFLEMIGGGLFLGHSLIIIKWTAFDFDEKLTQNNSVIITFQKIFSTEFWSWSGALDLSIWFGKQNNAVSAKILNQKYGGKKSDFNFVPLLFTLLTFSFLYYSWKFFELFRFF